MVDLHDSTIETSTVTTEPELAIDIRDLHKRFGRTEVLRGLDLAVPRHSVFGFLGPNGAGKSTTMKILVGLLRPSGGSARVAGRDVRREGVAARACIGYLPQDVSYWRHLTVRGVLKFTAERYVHGDRRAIAEQVDATMELAGLTKLADRRVPKLSGGERQRLGVAQAWVGRPDVLILDEPSAGLDPEGRHEVLAILDALPRTGDDLLFDAHPRRHRTCQRHHCRPRWGQHRRAGSDRVVPHRQRRGLQRDGEWIVRRRVRRHCDTTVGAVSRIRWNRPLEHLRQRPAQSRSPAAQAPRRRPRRAGDRFPTGAPQPRGHLSRSGGRQP